jgi:pilin isopeptide linkage protein/LPXTG-motif cell wall-anchored protein
VIDTKKPGYIYDIRVYTIEVWVDSMSVDIVVWDEDREKAENIQFENSYKVSPSEPIKMTDPPVKKTVSGNPSYKTTFEFKLEAQTASSPMPAGSVNGTKTIKITGSGEGEFGTWSYDKAGTYYYIVYEVNTGASGYIYDTAVYMITDTVKEENGQFVLFRTVTNNLGKQVSAFTFINTFKEGKLGPKTGDDTPITLYLIMLAVGGALASGAMVSLRRSRKAQ